MHVLSLMISRLLSFARRSAATLWLVVALLYMGAITINSLRNTLESRAQITNLETQLGSLQAERQRLTALLVYYQSDGYKEKELRRTLLLKRPEEKVYALPESGLARRQEQEERVAIAAAKRDPRLNLSNTEQWLRYLQGK